MVVKGDVIMIKSVVINNVTFKLDVIEISEEVSEPTGNTLKRVKLKGEIRGKTTYNEFKELIKQKPLNVKISDDNINISCKYENESYSYTDTENEYTIYKYAFDFLELDKDLPEEWNMNVGFTTTAVMNWIRIRALSNLLIEKGIITLNEYENEIHKLAETDYDSLVKSVLYGLPPKKQEP